MRRHLVGAILLIGGLTLVTCATAEATSRVGRFVPSGLVLGAHSKTEKKLPHVGNAFIVGQFRVVVHSVRCGIKSVGSDGTTVTAHGQFCALRITLLNDSKKPAFYSSDSDIAFSSSGQQFGWNSDDVDADTAGNSFANGDSGMDGATVNPTYSLTGNLYFEIPIRDKLTKVHLYTAYFPPGKGQVVLLDG